MEQVARLEDVPRDRGMAVSVGGTEMVLIRDGDAVRALAGKCPHAGAPLAEGAVCDGRLICPWHKAVFRIADGGLLEPPALERLATYPTRVGADGAVFAAVEAPPGAVPANTSTPDLRTMAIVGGGAAGAAAAAGLREFGFGGAIVMISAEGGAPYDRTALSKFVLSGDMPPDEVPPVLSDEALARHRITLVHDEVVALDAATRRITLRRGAAFDYAQALVATGGRAKRLDIDGAGMAGVQTLRDRADAAAIVAGLGDGSRVVILGGSFIGLEAASALRERGLAVTVVAPDEVPFAKQFGPQIGGMFRALHEAHGTQFQTGRTASRIEGDDRVRRVVLDDGTVLAADLVIAGIGVAPETGFVHGVMRDEDGGIPVDATLQAAPGLFAGGDVARFPLPGQDGLVRIEHWRLAQQHGRLAARNMLGAGLAFEGVPFFWTYHFGKRFEYLGHATTWDDVLIEGDLASHRFVALLVRDDQVAAVVACDRERATAMLAERMRAPLAAAAALAMVSEC